MATEYSIDIDENIISDITEKTEELAVEVAGEFKNDQEAATLGNLNLYKDSQGNLIPIGAMPEEKIDPEFKLDVDYYDFKEMRKYWDSLFSEETLGEDETVRIVYFAVDPNEKDKKLTAAEKKKQIKIEGTYKKQINSFESLLEAIKILQHQNKGKHLGISIGSAIFKYDSSPDNESGPGINSFDRTRTMVLDIDCYYHASKSQKERLNFSAFTFENMQFVAIQVYNQINSLLSAKSAPLLIPNKVYCTGGGFQFHVTFDESLNKQETEKIFKMYKYVLNSDRFLVTGILDSDFLGGSVLDFYADIDMTFADISHVQRLGGMKNQKYNFMPLDLTEIFGYEVGKLVQLKDEGNREKFSVSILSSTELFDLVKGYFNNNPETSINNLIHSSSRTTDEKKFLYNKIEQILNNYSIYLKASFGIRMTKQDYVSLTGMVIKPDKVINEATSVGDASLNDILFKINGNLALGILRDELDFRQEFGNLVKANCPFHDESHASFAIYKNENGKTILMDFHDNETYNMVTFWMKYKEVDRNTAINQLVSRAGITFNGKESKSLQKVLEKSSVEDLIKEIDRESFIYYRLATKQKHCIVRHIDSGEYFVFDGSKMLADHVLDNQLKQKGLDPEFRALFHIAFVEYVLIDAFEEFSPGMPSHFTREFIQFVNTWIPGNNYKEVHKLAANLEAMDVDSALGMLKDNTPWMYKYLLQLTQKGNLKYFVNWLAASSQFRIMPILPIMTSNFGTGKNLFVDEVLNFYFNAEYVNVMSSDRVQSQFNSSLETCSMLVLDEGEFSKSKEVDNLKFLTGNNTLMVEKKGVDAAKKKKWFNTIMLTNGETPIVHPIGERRFTYFRLDVPLHVTCAELGITIDDFIDLIRPELIDFWSILAKTQVNLNWSFQADKNNQYFKQILMMHSFGKLVIMMLNDKWEDITLQMNESVDDQIVMNNNVNMIKNIQEQFSSNGRISLSLINKYIKSLNFKNYISVQHFIENNHLKEHGFSIETSGSNIEIVLELDKIKKSVSMINNLVEIIPNYFKGVEEIEFAIKSKESKNRQKKADPAAYVSQSPTVPDNLPKDVTKAELEQFNPAAGISLPPLPGMPVPGVELNLNKLGMPQIPG